MKGLDGETRDQSLKGLLASLPEAGAERIRLSALLRRVDTKFLFPASGLQQLIKTLHGSYGVLPAAGKAIASYQTLYFDTAGLSFYRQHHRGRRARYKIRIRHYLDRELSMLEVKRKTNHNVTIKTRMEHDFLDNSLSEQDLEFLAGRTNESPAHMAPSVWTNFSRITLVHLSKPERMTIDLGLEFQRDDLARRLDGLAIIEVKQPHFHARSPAMLAVRAQGIRRSGSSKYCTALSTLIPTIKHNKFLPTLRKIRRLSNA